MSQKEKVLGMLKSQEWVTVPDMLQEYITRGAAIICILRKEGHEIKGQPVWGKRYYAYQLIPKETLW